MLNLNHKGVRYQSVAKLAQSLDLMESKLISYNPEGEQLCALAGSMCYDTEGVLDDNGDLTAKGRGVIKHCVSGGHNTVLEHASATFVKKVPIFVARQDMRTRHASYDERSLRYCRNDTGMLTYYTPPHFSTEYIDSIEDTAIRNELRALADMWVTTHEKALDFYSKYTDDELMERLWKPLDFSKERVLETGRAVLPLGINTTFIDTRNAWSWYIHAKKRTCLRAQNEIQLVRSQELEQLKMVYPTIFAGVDRPCRMGGCAESKPCGKVKLDANRRAVE